MNEYIKKCFIGQFLLVFAGLPLLIWVLGDFPQRTLLKELISVITLLAFCQMIGMFFMARSNRLAIEGLTISKVVKYHKIVGYTFAIILFLHPLSIVIPRFFEAGITPFDAFIKIITTYNQGVVLGITAWSLMLVLVVTSLLRNKLPMKYETWRIFHGILALIMISVALWHVIDLGRHINLAMSLLFGILTAGGILLLLRTYIFQNERITGRVK